jgi:peptide-methionine (S)-S-oxide reductase
MRAHGEHRWVANARGRAAVAGLALVLAAGVLAAAVLGARGGPVAADAVRSLPPPVHDIAPGEATSSVVVLAGGCFWGVQGVYQHVRGVTSAVSGYAGGEKRTANYEVVSMGATGHAESVQVTFDPRQVTYGRLLQIFFSVVHDPTEINRQGPDTGTQYRSAIFVANADQLEVAKAYIVQLDAARAFGRPIATVVEANRPFYPAEDYHQDFLTRNPSYPYIVVNDLPKIAELKRVFPDLYRAAPMLVGRGHDGR